MIWARMLAYITGTVDQELRKALGFWPIVDICCMIVTVSTVHVLPADRRGEGEVSGSAPEGPQSECLRNVG